VDEEKLKMVTGTFHNLVRSGNEAIHRARTAELTTEQRANRAQQAERRARDDRARRFLTTTVLRSLSRGSDFLFAFVSVAVLAAMFTPLGIVPQVITAVAIGSAILCAVRVLRVRARLHRAETALPFRVTNIGLALDWGRSYPSCTVDLFFAADVPSSSDLVALFANVRSSRHRQAVKVAEREGNRVRIEVDSETGSKFDGHRRWLTRWILRAIPWALVPLHEAFPLEEVRFPE
jgi:hypothetical protein